MNNKLKANTADSDILNLPKVNNKDTKIDNVTQFVWILKPNSIYKFKVKIKSTNIMNWTCPKLSITP